MGESPQKPVYIGYVPSSRFTIRMSLSVRDVGEWDGLDRLVFQALYRPADAIWKKIGRVEWAINKDRALSGFRRQRSGFILPAPWGEPEFFYG